MKRLLFLTAIICACTNNSDCQVRESSHEIGLWGGGSYYLGDLNTDKHYSTAHLAGGILYRRNFNKRLTLRLNVNYGTVSAADSLASNSTQSTRNLSFRSRIIEIGPVLEVNFINYKPGNMKKDFATMYLFGGINYFNMNPQAQLEGEWYELQSLGTEGQGSGLNSKQYKLNQFSIPLGIGVRWNISKKFCMSIEYGIRKTFTDHLDDVSGYYADPDQLEEANGALAAYFADMSAAGNMAGTLRGNPNNKDWYTFSGLALTMKIGKGNSCRGAQ